MTISRRARIGLSILGVAAVGGSLPANPATADDKPADQQPSSQNIAAFKTEVPQDLDLRDALTARYPGFGGIYVVEKTQIAVLLFQGTAPSAEEVAAIASEFGFGTDDYVIEHSEWTRASQLDLESHLIDAYGTGPIAGTTATAAGLSIDDEHGVVNLAVTGASADTVKEALAGDEKVSEALASGRLAIDEVGPAGDSWANRWSDTAPYNGGNLLYTGGSQPDCTSGWPVTKGGNRAFLTAGHCGENKYYTGYPGSGSNYVGESAGSTVAGGSSLATSTGDSQLIEGGSVNNKTWRYFDTRIQPVGTAAPARGRVVCFGGAVTAFQLLSSGSSEHELCGTIDKVDARNPYNDGWRLGLSCVWGYRYIGQGGDSGGPVYWDTVYGTGAAGTISGPDYGAPPPGSQPGDVGSCFTQIATAEYWTQADVITL